MPPVGTVERVSYITPDVGFDGRIEKLYALKSTGNLETMPNVHVEQSAFLAKLPAACCRTVGIGGKIRDPIEPVSIAFGIPEVDKQLVAEIDQMVRVGLPQQVIARPDIAPARGLIIKQFGFGLEEPMPGTI